MAEPGSIAEKVKQQADIVRLVGDYVRLKKSGQNFLGLCPFHSEKTPSFAVHPVKQIYHCFGCGAGGDVFKFVMEMEKVSFPEALKLVADKVGVRLPERRPRTPEEAKASRLRSALVELNEQAAQFFAEQLMQTKEGKLVRDYLNDRGLTGETIKAFGLGYAPGTGDALLRRLRERGAKPEALEASGLVNRDERGTLYDRFRRRVMFPIWNESGRIVAFGGRAMGDDQPKYLNSPETPVYSKSRVLYNLHRAKDAIRRAGFAIIVEGYMDCIGVHSAGLLNAVATCGTSLTETQARLLHRLTPRVAVSYDADSAGKAATERSLDLLLTEDLDVHVVMLPSADPDTYIQERGSEAYQELVRRCIDVFAPLTKKARTDEKLQGQVKQVVPYRQFLVNRAKEQFDLATLDGKLAAVNYLLPRLAQVKHKIRRAEWATELAATLDIRESILREELRRAAAERRPEVKLKPEHARVLAAGAAKPAERRLLQILLENEAIRADLLTELEDAGAHQGAGLEAVFEQALELTRAGQPLTLEGLAERVGDAERRLLYELAFDSSPQAVGTLEEARSCLAAMLRRKLEAELRGVQSDIQKAEQTLRAEPSGQAAPAAGQAGQELKELLARKQALRRALSDLGG